MLFGDRFFHDFSDDIFPVFVRKCSPKGVQMGTGMTQERCKKATRNHVGRHIRFGTRFVINFGTIWKDFGVLLEVFWMDFQTISVLFSYRLSLMFNV